MTDTLIETMARAMHEVEYAGQWDIGGERVREHFRNYARAALRAMTPDGEVMEAAALAFAGLKVAPECGRDEPHFIESCTACQKMQLHDEVRERIASASPILLASAQQRVEELEKERDFYRDTGKIETDYQLERAERAEAEVARLREGLRNLLRTVDEPQGAAQDARAIIEARALLGRTDG